MSEEEESPSLEDLIEVTKEEFTEKIDEWLTYQREKIGYTIDEWKEIDNYESFEEYIKDTMKNKVIDCEGQPLDLDMIVGLPNMIGKFFQEYAKVTKIKCETMNNPIEKYYLKNQDDLDLIEFGYIKTGEEKVTKIKELEDFIGGKNAVDNTKTLYI
ncbi:MAG TPA: hypothetical protein VI790_01265 [Candidatus Nanoarchaeia archaeon]|nr:hypothetical protein [Candidatus Nanoarchaeia archaeon]